MRPLPIYRCAWSAAGAVDVDDEAAWSAAPWCALSSWSGAPDPAAAAHGASGFQLLADAGALHLRARLATPEPWLDAARPTTHKSHGLWDFDVVELFLSPSPSGLPYGELEGSPLAQHLDYWIVEPRALVDREWRSGVAVRGAIAGGHSTVTLTAPWSAFGIAAARGVRARMNVYAALGPPARRRYLAWSPTETPEPDFHVPARFGWLEL